MIVKTKGISLCENRYINMFLGSTKFHRGKQVSESSFDFLELKLPLPRPLVHSVVSKYSTFAYHILLYRVTDTAGRENVLGGMVGKVFFFSLFFSFPNAVFYSAFHCSTSMLSLVMRLTLQAVLYPHAC